MGDNEEGERRTLLDFFRTQINTHAQIIISLIITVLSEGIATSFLPEGLGYLKLPIFLAGAGFFGGLAFLQWWKLFWYARLWNATLIDKPTSFQCVYGSLPRRGSKETPISKIYLGAHELLIENIKSMHLPLHRILIEN